MAFNNAEHMNKAHRAAQSPQAIAKRVATRRANMAARASSPTMREQLIAALAHVGRPVSASELRALHPHLPDSTARDLAGIYSSSDKVQRTGAPNRFLYSVKSAAAAAPDLRVQSTQPSRREVLDAVLAAHKPVTAYDLRQMRPEWAQAKIIGGMLSAMKTEGLLSRVPYQGPHDQSMGGLRYAYTAPGAGAPGRAEARTGRTMEFPLSAIPNIPRLKSKPNARPAKLSAEPEVMSAPLLGTASGAPVDVLAEVIVAVAKVLLRK